MEKETNLIIRITPKLKDSLSKVATDKNISSSEIVRSLISDYVDKYNNTKDRYFKALKKSTNKISGFGIEKSIDIFETRWNLREVDCYEISKKEFELLIKLHNLPNYEDYFEID